METFKISLLNQYSQRSKTQKYLAIILGIAYLIIPIVHIFQHDYSLFTIFWFILAMAMFASGYFYSKFASSYYLLMDEERIISKDSIFNKFNISWENIEHIKLNPISIVIFKKSNDEKRIHLQNLSYENVQIVKTKVQEFADSKKINIEF